jgi:HrpA-like RNA helicase
MKQNIVSLFNKYLFVYYMEKKGILDPEGNNLNPLTDKEYTQKYLDLAKIWSKFPAYNKANDIIDSITNNQVILVVSGTGSGKTVLVPKFALHTLDYKGNIAITLPKQIIAKSAAEFSAATLDVQLGQHVGYQYKGDSKKSDTTKLLYATDGTIVARLLNDPLLSDFNVVIIDEAHERKVQIDFLLYLLRNTMTVRKDFKVIIMSATINEEIFVSYFNTFKFTQINIDAETHYPIQSIYLEKPINTQKKEYLDKGLNIIMDILKNDNNDGSDILFFITSINEAKDMCQKLCYNIKDSNVKIQSDTVFCVEVYSGVNPKQQQLAQDKDLFKNNTKYKNKVVVATNVAESSLTIDGIKYVIDSGLEFKNYYDPKTKADRLDKSTITKAQVKQRKGRSGRTKPGICYHLYTEEEYNNMKEYPEPDIRISDISSECLKLLSLDMIKNTDDLIGTLTKLIEPPKEIYIRDGITKLKRLNLLKDHQLSDLGRLVSKLSSLLPEEAISILLSMQLKCSHEVVQILAMSAACKDNIDELFITPNSIIKNNPDAESMKIKLEKKFLKIKKSFYSQYGDHLSLLNIYTRFREVYKKDNDKKTNEWCYKYFLRKNVLLNAAKYKKRIRRSSIYRINRDELDIISKIFNEYIESYSNSEPKIRALVCLSVGFKINIVNTKGFKYKIPKSSFMSYKSKQPKQIVYKKLFISMNREEMNIVSTNII